MTTFIYKARNQQGELVSGTMEMENEQSIGSNLDKLGYSVLEITRPNRYFVSFGDWFLRFQRLDKQELIVFSRQLATLIKSGMPLLPSLSTICDQTTNRRFRVIIEDVRQSVQEGESFSDSLVKHPTVFPELFVSMVRVGEAGGIMDDVLNRLALLSTQEMEIYSRIRSAMTYPIVLMVIAFVIVNFIMVGVLPKFVTVFNASKAQLPLPTQIVLGMSWVIRNFWWAILLGLAVCGFYFRRYIQTVRGRRRFHRLLLKIPVFGELYTKIQIARFARTLSTLTGTGVPILQALMTVEKTITNTVLREAVEGIRAAISAGSSVVEPFKASGFFPPMVIQMISIGEKSGKLDEMLEEVAGFYDPEIEYTIKNLTSLLEPFMLLCMGLMVAFIALSVLLPIFNLMKVFRA